jgi:endonuclease YncB( thermonuclease family)
VGGFIGVLYVGGGNLGKGLLEEGLGWVQGGSGGQEFDDAESRAKKAKKGVTQSFERVDIDLERLGRGERSGGIESGQWRDSTEIKEGVY